MESTIDFKREEKLKRRRAHQACERCRSRKVRCDLVARGKPCTNCTLDNCSCIILPSTRGLQKYREGSRLERPKNLPAVSDKMKPPRVLCAKTLYSSSHSQESPLGPTSEASGNGSVDPGLGELSKAAAIAYVDYIHPQVPVLSLQTIRLTLEDDSQDPMESLGSFRVNALVAAALPHVPKRRLKACGLKSEKDMLMARRLHLAKAEVFRPAVFKTKKTPIY